VLPVGNVLLHFHSGSLVKSLEDNKNVCGGYLSFDVLMCDCLCREAKTTQTTTQPFPLHGQARLKTRWQDVTIKKKKKRTLVTTIYNIRACIGRHPNLNRWDENLHLCAAAAATLLLLLLLLLMMAQAKVWTLNSKSQITPLPLAEVLGADCSPCLLLLLLLLLRLREALLFQASQTDLG